MITTALLSIVYAFVTGLLALFSTLGTVSTNSTIIASINTLKSYYVPLNAILPVSTLVSIAGFVLVFETALITYKFIKWGYEKIPGIN